MINKVKKATKLIIIIINSIFIIVASTQQSYALELTNTTEAIEKFEADITVQHNRLIKVTEHITYNLSMLELILVYHPMQSAILQPTVIPVNMVANSTIVSCSGNP